MFHIEQNLMKTFSITTTTTVLVVTSANEQSARLKAIKHIPLHDYIVEVCECETEDEDNN